MGKIVLLDDLTINKIAAGEVIERPASAVKELVENSIDAGATSINVEIKNGGISYIRVTDNGKGIEQDDMEIAFERHATSKIRSAQDLETVKSMGFRGEALASIAAISKVTMQSKTSENDIGNQIVVEGGNIISKDEIGCPNGTSITIENLFYNTPVRYKFLRRDFTEAGYIEDALTRIALVHPEISIKLMNSGKVVLQTSGNNDIKSVIYGIYGKDIAENLLKVDYDYEDIKITGVIGKPEIARSNRANQLFFVNQRYIKSPILSSGAEQAYKGIMPAGKFAFLVLNLEINPQNVDVNVHPAKLEVRFEEEQKVFRAIYNAIKDTLSKNNTSNNNLKKEDTNQQFITDWYQKQEEDVKPKIEAINTVDYKQDNVSKSEASNEESQSKGFFKNFLSKKEEVKPNLIEQVYQTRQLTTIGDQPMVKKDEITQSISKIQEDIEKMQKEIENKSEAKQQDNAMFAETEQESENKIEIEQETESKAETVQETESKAETVQETESNSENTSEKENVQDTIASMLEKIDEISGNINKNQNDICDNINKTQNDLEPEEKFEKMYESIFGKTPKSNIKSEVKEEPETYKIPQADILTSENISLFEKTEEKNIPKYKFIGTAFDNYIVIELEKELYIIDQKVANEKIVYENLKNSYYSEKEKDSQLMLLPDIINVNEKQLSVVNENMEMFKKAGFTVEEFGENTIKLSGVPNICIDLDTKELFLEILNEVNKVARTERQEIEEKFIITVAKRIASNLKMKVTKDEIDELMQELLILPDAFISPTGKPIAIKMTRADIERKFARR